MANDPNHCWAALITESGQKEVYPLNDLAEHVVGAPCWCDPFDDDGARVHNSADRREEYERGRKAS